MRENRMDGITDILKARVNRIVGNAHNRFGGSIPYRQVQVTPEERIMGYMDYLQEPEIEQELLQQGEGASVQKYHSDMQKLIQGRRKNA